MQAVANSQESGRPGRPLRALLLVLIFLLSSMGLAFGQATYADLHDFNPGNPDDVVVRDAQGNLWGTATDGGANGGGMIWEISEGGTFADVHDFRVDGTDGYGPVGPLVVDGSGNVYGVTYYGGSDGTDNGMVWEYGPGAGYIPLANLGDGSLQFPTSLVFDGQGNLWGTAQVGGSYGEGGIWEIAGGTYAEPYSFQGGATDGGMPSAITTDGTNLFGTASSAGANGYGTLWEYSGSILTDLHDFTSSDSLPAAYALGISGEDVYGTTYLEVWHFNSGSGFNVVATLPAAHGDGGIYGPVCSSSVAIDSANNLYGTSELGGSRGDGYLWKVPAAGGTVTTLRTFGVGEDGQTPIGGVCVDSAGDLYGDCFEGGANGGGMVFEYAVPPRLLSVTCAPSSMVGGRSATGTVTLSGPAGVNQPVYLSSAASSILSVPASVTVPAGQTQATFPVATSGVAVVTPVVVSASLNGITHTTGAKVEPASLISVTRTPATLVCGNTATGTVTLNGPAPAGGLSITLSPTSGAAYTSGSVTVSAGATSATFPISTSAVTSITTVTVAAGLNEVTRSVGITVEPPALTYVTVGPSSVVGGASSTGTVGIATALAFDLAIPLGSSSDSASVPPTVTIPAGSKSATFSVTTVPVASNTGATISATLVNSTKSATLTIRAPAVTAFRVPGMITTNEVDACTVVISSPAPSGGLPITLASTNPGVSIPATVTIPAGQTQASFNVTGLAVASPVIGNLTATLNGAVKSAPITVKP